jgi:hypothetical protein
MQFKKSSNHVQRSKGTSKTKEKALNWWEFNIEEIDFTLTQFEDKFRGKDNIHL